MTTTGGGRFEGKVAFVTGAGSGIGRATALAFAREGTCEMVAGVLEQDHQEKSAINRAFHDADHPSRLVLPTIER